MRRRLTATDKGLLVLLVAFACLAATYSVVTPLFEASDEVHHYPFVSHLAKGGSLPLQDPKNPGPWLQEGSQPPLYYALASLIVRWVPDEDWAQLLPDNPHADIGIARPDRNANLVLHGPGEGFPYRGAALAIHLARGFSVVLGVVTVLFTYLVGLEMLPGRPWLALAGAAVAALTPMFLFITGSVNNDNLVAALSTASVWLILRSLRLPPTPWRWGLVGVLIGLAALSKVSAVGLLGLAALALAWLAWRRRDWRLFVWAGVCVVGAASLVGGWWYYRNWRLYGDPLGFNAMLAVAGRRATRPGLRQLAGEWQGFVRVYWGVFGGMNVLAPAWFYRLLNALALLAAVGLGLGGARWLLRRHQLRADTAARLALLAIWPVIVAIGLARWTMLTMASQGRLLFPAIASLSYLMVFGFSCWVNLVRLPSNVKRQASGVRFLTFDVSRLTLPVSRITPYASRLTPFLVPALLAVLAAWIPFGVIAPAYARPPLLTPAAQAGIPNRLDVTFDGRMELLGYALSAGEAKPGQGLELTLYWRALSSMERNYSVFVHLVDENGIKIAQRDVYPGGGTFPTTLWQPGDAVADSYAISVPANTFCPNRLSIQAGLYQLESGARLPVRDREGDELGDSVRFGEVLVRREPEGGIANPIHLSLGNKVEVLGYDLDRTALPAGEALHLSLSWKALAPLPRDYTVFAQVTDSLGNPWAGWASEPLSGSGLRAGETATRSCDLPLPPDTPEGTYYVEAGAYLHEPLQYLNLLDQWGNVRDDRAVLTRIRVLPAARPDPMEPEYTFPPIQFPLDVTFGEVARLRGYSLEQEAVNPHERLRLTLYWEAIGETPPETGYTVFTHLLDTGGRLVAQHDGPPASGSWPATTWRQGQAIVDRHDLVFTVSGYEGEGLLEVGLYDPATLQRLTTSEGSDRVILPERVMVRP